MNSITLKLLDNLLQIANNVNSTVETIIDFSIEKSENIPDLNNYIDLSIILNKMVEQLEAKRSKIKA
ncbi:hypothetical protein L3V83_15510 [Thiotrichales bacterium 19X7-9]|nr:hypothetical protein [Thiotrichales bacterium 19X7-9]